MQDSNRERLEAALKGEPVTHPVYAVYDWFVNNRPIDWDSLFGQGLGQINHADLVRHERPNVHIAEEVTETDKGTRRDVCWTADLGRLHEAYLGEWRQEYLIKTPEDYRIMTLALEGTKILPTPEVFERSEELLVDRGLTVGQLNRTPLQHVQIDLVGLERFSFDLADELPELMELLELLTELKLKEFELAAAGPARYIKLWENLSIETMGPRYFRRYLVPVYQRIQDILDGSGKKLLVHYDGQLRTIAEDIAQLPFDGIDSFTCPPEGDMSVGEARRHWPDKFLWLHPNLGWYLLPEKDLISNITQMTEEAGDSRYCLMISEEVPPDWERTVPAILQALRP